MSFARVGTGSAKVIGDAVGDPWTLAGIPSSVAGHLLVCRVSGSGGSLNITSAADNTGTGVWVVLQSALSGGNNRAAIIYCLNCPAGVTSLIITGTAGSPYVVGSVDEFSFTGTCAKDANNSAVGPSVPTALNTGNITNAATGGLNHICAGSDDSFAGTWDAIETGYTSTHDEGDTSIHHASQAGFQIMSGTGPFSANFQYNQETADAAAIIVSFKEVGGAAATSRPVFPSFPQVLLNF